MVFGLDHAHFVHCHYTLFQFPVGIRWCSDMSHSPKWTVGQVVFQFPVGIRWCSDILNQNDPDTPFTVFQFPVGIRWCSDKQIDKLK